MVQHNFIDSPIGVLTLVKTDGVLSGLYTGMSGDTLPEAFGARAIHEFEDVAEQLQEYFARSRTTFTVPVALAGTPFQQRVWAELMTIPYGTTRSYGQLAEAIGNRSAMRAVGAANGRNPISIIVPCHRVIGSNGALVGMGAGWSGNGFCSSWNARPFRRTRNYSDAMRSVRRAPVPF